jgi:hypothetical protein
LPARPGRHRTPGRNLIWREIGMQHLLEGVQRRGTVGRSGRLLGLGRYRRWSGVDVINLFSRSLAKLERWSLEASPV